MSFLFEKDFKNDPENSIYYFLKIIFSIFYKKNFEKKFLASKRNLTLKFLQNFIYHPLNFSNNKISTKSQDKTKKVWDLDTKCCIQTLIEYEGSVYRFSKNFNEQNSSIVAACITNRTIKIWDLT